MSNTRTLKFTCDRCGKVEERDMSVSPSWQPTGWRGVIVTTPPLADVMETTRRHLCERCSKHLSHFLERLSETDTAGAA